MGFEFAQRRLKAKGGTLRCTVRIFKTTARDSYAWIFIHKVDQRFEGVGTDDRIRIQQQAILWRPRRLQGLPQDHVVAACETKVSGDREQLTPFFPAIFVDRSLKFLS